MSTQNEIDLPFADKRTIDACDGAYVLVLAAVAEMGGAACEIDLLEALNIERDLLQFRVHSLARVGYLDGGEDRWVLSRYGRKRVIDAAKRRGFVPKHRRASAVGLATSQAIHHGQAILP